MELTPGNSTLVAKVMLISPNMGGRRVPPNPSGYRGQFFYNDIDCDAVHIFDVNGQVPFGQEITDFVFLINPDHREHVREGMPFLIREGPKTVGYGQIVEVRPAIS
jgi:translation elongation factor EF-Tu-like GTPase